MSLATRATSLFRFVVRRSRLESEMDAELRHHVESRADDLVRSGVPRVEAERRARVEFGSLEGWREDGREAQTLRIVNEAQQETCAIGLAPAFNGSRVDCSLALKEGLGRGSQGIRGRRLKHGLVVFELALALMVP